MDRCRFIMYDFATIGVFKQSYFSFFYINLVKTSLIPRSLHGKKFNLSYLVSFVGFHSHRNAETSLTRFGWEGHLPDPLCGPLWCGGEHRCLGFIFPSPHDSSFLPTLCRLHGPWLPRSSENLDVQNLCRCLTSQERSPTSLPLNFWKTKARRQAVRGYFFLFLAFSWSKRTQNLVCVCVETGVGGGEDMMEKKSKRTKQVNMCCFVESSHLCIERSQ